MDFPDVLKITKPIERTSFPHPEFKNDKKLQIITQKIFAHFPLSHLQPRNRPFEAGNGS